MAQGPGVVAISVAKSKHDMSGRSRHDMHKTSTVTGNARIRLPRMNTLTSSFGVHSMDAPMLLRPRSWLFPESTGWLHENELPPFHSRRRIGYFLENRWVKIFMASIIICNTVQVVYESEQIQVCKYGSGREKSDACNAVQGWLHTCNWIYLAIYTLESCLRLYRDRIWFFLDKVDVFDLFIVVMGFMSQILTDSLQLIGILRLFRLARLAKAFRVITLPGELHIMVHGFLTAVRAIVMGTGLIALMLVVWSVAAVELLNELNHEEEILHFYDSVGCERCSRAWSSVWYASLTFLQTTLMGDSWGMYALPMVERHWWTLGIFVGVPFSIVLGLTNLILAVIVDKALQQHTEDELDEALERQIQVEAARENLVRLCSNLDVDGSGYLTLEEFLDGYENEKDFRDQLTVLGIHGGELEKLFHMLDKDRSGDVSYQEFASQLAEIKRQDLHAMSTFIKHHILNLAAEVADVKAALVPREEIFRMRTKRDATMTCGGSRTEGWSSVGTTRKSYEDMPLNKVSSGYISTRRGHDKFVDSDPYLPRHTRSDSHLPRRMQSDGPGAGARGGGGGGTTHHGAPASLHGGPLGVQLAADLRHRLEQRLGVLCKHWEQQVAVCFEQCLGASLGCDVGLAAARTGSARSSSPPQVERQHSFEDVQSRVSERSLPSLESGIESNGTGAGRGRSSKDGGRPSIRWSCKPDDFGKMQDEILSKVLRLEGQIGSLLQQMTGPGSGKAVDAPPPMQATTSPWLLSHSMPCDALKMEATKSTKSNNQAHTLESRALLPTDDGGHQHQSGIPPVHIGGDVSSSGDKQHCKL